MLEEMKTGFQPGDIIYADSNFSQLYDCFGVVVNKKFWLEQVKTENVLEESLNEFDEKRDVPFRVLGRKMFRQYWRANNPDEVEPDEHKLMHYRFNSILYTAKIDLRPFIKLQETKTDNFTSHVRGFFTFEDEYFRGALDDARIVYDYLEDRRFDIKKGKYVFSEQKLLRLLEKAIPLKK